MKPKIRKRKLEIDSRMAKAHTAHSANTARTSSTANTASIYAYII